MNTPPRLAIPLSPDGARNLRRADRPDLNVRWTAPKCLGFHFFRIDVFGCRVHDQPTQRHNSHLRGIRYLPHEISRHWIVNFVPIDADGVHIEKKIYRSRARFRSLPHIAWELSPNRRPLVNRSVNVRFWADSGTSNQTLPGNAGRFRCAETRTRGICSRDFGPPESVRTRTW
jgi:hypothetical protein